MTKPCLLLLSCIFLFSCGTKPPVSSEEKETKQENQQSKKIYRAAYTKYVDLVHTKLNVSFNWKEKQLNGQATITMHPHFYTTDSVRLNARGMDLKEIAIISKDGNHSPLKFEYDSKIISIHLDRSYTKDESFTLFISYVSKPELLPEGGSDAITKDKGLYFIDADSLDDSRPTQVWTQGETESNSVWFPTIEDPGQKMTQEIYITVDTAFTTISNGLLISTASNNDGTKTDYWKQSLPAAPYLTMIAAGNFSVVKDHWKNIEVNYYVDPPYEKFARMTYGHTPEMIGFFSDLLGVPYVWEKYSQVVVHDYVSGAMENTTAVIHGVNMQQDSREYVDYNYEDYISHELFHHWFGDLITTESWSNITLNEGFANYAEYLWRDHKFGRDDADYQNQGELSTYLYVVTENDPPLIRFNYEDREDMYDGISYNKGGRVLHMLRSYVGDSAFFSSLHDYLSAHMFSTVEINDLRMSFEKITGEDLNWFFNQWCYKGGHPDINIDYNWDDSLHLETVTISQKQNLDKNPLYRIPLFVDLYFNGKKERKQIVVDEPVQKFTFSIPVKPDLVNVDANKSLLCSKTDHKTNSEYIFQYNHAPLYIDRYEAITGIGNNYKVKTPEADMIIRALDDRFYMIRLDALTHIGELALNDPEKVKEKIIKLAIDSSSDVREQALVMLNKYFSYSENSALFINALKDSSYSVEARAFKIIADKDVNKAKELAPLLEADSGSAILSRLSEYYSTSKTDKTQFYEKAIRLCRGYARYQIVKDFTKYLRNSPEDDIIRAGADVLVERAKKSSSKNYHSAIVSSLKEIESSIKQKISDEEEAKNNMTDSALIAIKESDILRLKALRSKLHEKIVSIDK